VTIHSLLKTGAELSNDPFNLSQEFGKKEAPNGASKFSNEV
jgi:hypothetical protein